MKWNLIKCQYFILWRWRVRPPGKNEQQNRFIKQFVKRENEESILNETEVTFAKDLAKLYTLQDACKFVNKANVNGSWCIEKIR